MVNHISKSLFPIINCASWSAFHLARLWSILAAHEIDLVKARPVFIGGERHFGFIIPILFMETVRWKFNASASRCKAASF